jgi:hypothetical protein
MTAQMATFVLLTCFITRQLIMTYVNQFKIQSLAKMVTVSIMRGECKQVR